MRSRTLLVAAILVNIGVALVPFRLDLPRVVSNRLARQQDGSLLFRPPSLALTSGGPQWIDEAVAAQNLTVQLTVIPSIAVQRGPARILTISQDFTLRNLMVGQEGADLIVRLRRPRSDPNGMPAYVVPDVLQSGRLRDIVVSIRPQRLLVEVDGTRRVDHRLPPDALAGWDPSFRLALGNEVIGARPWAGQMVRAMVTTPSVRDDLLAPGRLEVPAQWWHVPDRLSNVAQVDLPVDAAVAALHLLAFLPIGYLLRRVQPGPGQERRVVASVGALSLAIELLKVVVAGRHPSILNLVAQIAGGLLGASLQSTWPRRHR